MVSVPGSGAARSALRLAGQLVALPGQVVATVTAAQRTAERADRVTAELEGPLLALAPGLARLAVVLEDPVVEDLPATLRQVKADLLPVLRTLADTSERVAGLPGAAGLLGLLRPSVRPAIVVDPPAP